MAETDLFVRINGDSVGGLLHAFITTTNCFSADTFALTFAIDSFAPDNISFWSATPSAYIEIIIRANFRAAEQTLITGMVDTVVIDPVCRTVGVEGRDLSSSLIDCYRQQDFVNQTASEVVAQVALSHALTPVVTLTSGSVGRYYGDGYTRLSLGQFSRLRSDWDLIVELARENSFDAFVQGRMLFFQPSNTISQVPVHLGLSDVLRMRIERSLNIKSDTAARVQSWDSRKMVSYDSKNIVSNLTAAGTANADGGQTFLFSASNFTFSQVTGSAARFTTELERLKTVLQFDSPWDLRLSPRSPIAFDDLYNFVGTSFAIDSIERRYSSLAGSTQTIRAVSA